MQGGRPLQTIEDREVTMWERLLRGLLRHQERVKEVVLWGTAHNKEGVVAGCAIDTFRELCEGLQCGS